jgi:hypothetical protein
MIAMVNLLAAAAKTAEPFDIPQNKIPSSNRKVYVIYLRGLLGYGSRIPFLSLLEANWKFLEIEKLCLLRRRQFLEFSFSTSSYVNVRFKHI